MNFAGFTRTAFALVFLVLYVPASAPAANSAPDDKKPGPFSQLFKKHQPASALDDLRREETLDAQHDRARRLAAELERKIDATDDKDEKDDYEDTLEIVEYVEDWLTRAMNSNPREREIFSVNTQADRILNAVENPDESGIIPPLNELFVHVAINGIFGHAFPRLSPEKQSRPLGAKGASKETAFLYDPDDGSFFTAEELAAMTPLEVSLLDVSPEHPAWFREADIERIRRGRLSAFERELQTGMNIALRAKDDLDKDEHWGLHAAHKVLFMDRVERSATSPKTKTEDAYGVSWKLKWGDEVMTEPVASRLYLLVGAKNTDGNFVAGHGRGDLVLILEEAGEYAAADKRSPRSPETVTQLADTLHDFFKFDLGPFIHDQGVITEDNVDEILKNHPGAGKKKYRKDRVIGRTWVSFKESMVELKPKGYIRRFESARLSDLAALNDRVARGTSLFNLWIANRDVKDGNNKGYFIKQPRGKKGKMEIASYEEGQHDLGFSMGSILSAGKVNDLKTGRGFVRKGLFGGKFRFPISTLFKPDSWGIATWADGMWMARKIADMSEGEIREAVSYSDWPDFAKEALVYKLTGRRNQIAEIYEITDRLDRYSVEAPSMAVTLGSSAEILAAEKRYRLPKGVLQNELTAAGAGPDYIDVPLSRGQIAKGKKSILVRLLERHRHPSGLGSRYDRFLDTMPSSAKATFE